MLEADQVESFHRDGFLTIARVTNYVDIIFVVQIHSVGLTHQLVIVDHQYTDLVVCHTHLLRKLPISYRDIQSLWSNRRGTFLL